MTCIKWYWFIIKKCILATIYHNITKNLAEILFNYTQVLTVVSLEVKIYFVYLRLVKKEDNFPQFLSI